MFRSNPAKLPVNSQVSLGLTNDGLIVIEAPDGTAILLTAGLARALARSLANLAAEAPALEASAGYAVLMRLSEKSEAGEQ